MRIQVLRAGITATVMMASLIAGGGESHAAGTSPAATPQTVSSVADAVALARKTGVPVEAPEATTATDTVKANPNGTVTLIRHAAPVRKRVNGKWAPLDATLHRSSDGTVLPATTISDLSFSGGGTGPLVTMAQAGKHLALSLPLSLPTPAIDGATATYRDVLPGVDLQVSATTLGGFTQVFVVRDAAAAANPALKALTLKAGTTDLSLSADAEGNLKAADASGRVFFIAPAPVMWDSAKPSGAREAQATRKAKPGAGAATKPVGVGLSRQTITLSPDPGLLTGKDTVFPLYIDPSWTPVTPTMGPQRWGYASVAEAFPTSNKWNNTADPNPDNMQLGWANTPWHARTMVNFNIDVGTLAGATIYDAHIDATVVYSGSCTQSRTRVFAPATTLTQSNATWNYWYNSVNLGSEVGSATFSGGYNSGCPGHAISPPFNVLGGVTAAVAAGRNIQTFVFTGDTNETSDTTSYKELSLASINLSITYNHVPGTPSNLSTSPQTSCTGAVSTVGDGDVLLYAPVSDPDGGTVGVRYEAWKGTSSGSPFVTTDPANTPAGSGTSAVLTLTQATLRAQAAGAVTEFSWHVQVWDGIATSGWSTTCKFNFDPTRPGPPGATAPAEGTTHIGQPVTISVTKPSSGPAPATYLYQFNAGAPVSVAADANGNASVTVTPTRRTNNLAISSVSAGGNVGVDAASIIFTTAPLTTPAAESDLTGDGIADFLTPGNTNGMPPGVWLAKGQSGARLQVNASNIGTNGNGVLGDNSATNFNGAQVITGRFADTGLQDVLAYYPAQGNGVIISGNGDGSALQAQFSGNAFTLTSSQMIERDDNGDPIPGAYPLQVANAGDTIGNGDNNADLIAVGGTAGNYHLSYYFYASILNLQGIIPLTTPPPVGGTTWDHWRISTAQTGAASRTSMFLWMPATGALYLWKDLDLSTGELTYQSYLLASSGWNTGASLILRAADINNDGTADIWTGGGTRTATAYLVSGTTATIQPRQTLLASMHSWNLTDIGAASSGATISTSADNSPAGTTSLPLSGNTGVTWGTGDMFSPHAVFNGTGGSMTTASSAIDTSQDFTVSVWAKPNGGTGQQNVVTQDGVTRAGFSIFYDAALGSWRFSMAKADAVNPGFDIAEGPAGGARLGVWSKLTANYQRANGEMNLYVNGVNVGRASHTTPWGATGRLRLGASLYQGNAMDFFSGRVSGAQSWNQLIVPQDGDTHTAGSWNLNGNGADSSGGNHALTPSGGFSWVPGRLLGGPQALNLDGSGGAAKTAGTLIDTSANFTVSAWVRPTATGYYRTVWSAESSVSNAVAIGMDDTGRWVMWARPDDPSGGVSVLGPPVALNVWTHLTGVYDASSRQIELYVNGVSAGKVTVAAIRKATGSFALGRYQYLGAYYGFFAGDIAEVKAWDRIVNPPEVKDLASPATLLGKWDLAGNGTDTSPFGRAMTGSGGYSWGTGRLPGLNALHLDGTSGMAGTTAAVLDSRYSYTVSAWVRPTGTGYFRTVLEGDAGVSNPFAIGMDDTGRWAAWSRPNDQSAGTNLLGPAVTLNAWTHIACVYDAATSQLRLYVNGSLTGQMIVSPSYQGNGKIVLGHYTWQGASYGFFAGDVAEVRVYNGVLSTPAISELATP